MLDKSDESVQKQADPRSATVISHSQVPPKAPPQICFDRRELMAILNVYGRMVAAGEMRDYAIDTLKDRAIFSMFRRTSERPVYAIEKNPKLARKQGAFSLVSEQGQILKRGHDLTSILALLNQKLMKLVEN